MTDNSLPGSQGFTSWLTSPEPYYQDTTGTRFEKSTLTVLLQGRPLGISHFIAGTESSLGYQRESWALFCPWCGEVWARLVNTDSRGQVRPFAVIPASCTSHPSPYQQPPGSLLAAGEALVGMLPREALLRELSLHLSRQEFTS